MADGTYLVELWRRMADDVHEILNMAKTGRHPDLLTDQIRVPDQSEGGRGAGDKYSANAARPRRRGDRINERAAQTAWVRDCRGIMRS